MSEIQGISLEPAVHKTSGIPYVLMKWGDKSGQLSPEDAIANAFALVEVAASAMIDANLAEWGKGDLSLSEDEVRMLINLVYTCRSVNSEVKIDTPDGPRSPLEMRKEILTMLVATMYAETESALTDFLSESMGMSRANIDKAILNFRKTKWP